MTFLAQGDYAQALTILDTLAARDKRHSLEGKLAVYKTMGDNRNILATIDALEKLAPLSTDLKIQKAIAMRNLGDWETSGALIAGIETEIAQNADYLVEYGRYLLWKQDYDAAQKTFEQALALNPAHEQALLGLAYAHTWKKEDDRAAELVGKILTANPDSVDARILNGWITAWKGAFAVAIDEFKRAEGLSKNHPEALRGLAQTYAWDGQYAESIAYYDRTVALQPGNPELLLALARVLHQNGEYSRAVDALTQARQAAPDRVDIVQELETAEKWTLEIDSTLRDLKKRISLNQGDVQDFITLGKTYSWLGKLKDSLKIYRQALDKDSGNVDLLVGLARVYENLDRPDEAVKTYRRVLELKSDYLEAKVRIDALAAAYRPQMTTQYALSVASTYDPDLRDTTTMSGSHMFTLELGQRLSSAYTLRTGTTLGWEFLNDLTTDTPYYNVFHHLFYIQNEVRFSNDVFAVLRNDFHYYGNRDFDVNYFNLSDSNVKYGGYALVQVPFQFNNFSVQYNRQFAPAFGDNGDLITTSVQTLTGSDDLVIAKNLSALVSGTASRIGADDDWTWSITLHPRYKLPFFEQAGVEYEWSFLTTPDRQHHKGIANVNVQIGSRLLNQLQYALTYYTLPDDFSHDAQWIFLWQPGEKWNVTMTNLVQYRGRSWTGASVVGATIAF